MLSRSFPWNLSSRIAALTGLHFKVKKFVCSRSTATTVFYDMPFGINTFGHAHPDKNSHTEEKCLEVAARPDTQLPSVFFNVKRADGSNVKMSLYADSLARNQKGVGFAMTYGKDEYIKEGLPESARLTQEAKEGKLLRIDIARYTDDDVPTTGAKGDPIWDCAATDAKALVGDIVQRAHSQVAGTSQAPLDYQDQLIGCLNASRRMSIWVFVPNLEQTEVDLGVLRSFDTFMKSCFWAAATRGNFWWYTLHSDIPLTSEDYPFNDGSKFIPHPRWLNMFYEVTWVDGAPVECRPLTLAFFGSPDKGLYPDADLSTFVSRLSAAREVQKQHHELVRLMKPSGTNITCKLRKLDDDEQYLASLSFNDLRDPSQLNALRPEFKRRVRINLTLEGSKISLEAMFVRTSQSQSPTPPSSASRPSGRRSASSIRTMSTG